MATISHRDKSVELVIEEILNPHRFIGGAIDALDLPVTCFNENMEEVLKLSRRVLLPGYFESETISRQNLCHTVGANLERLVLRLRPMVQDSIVAGKTASMTSRPAEELANHYIDQFILALPGLRHQLWSDIDAMYSANPSATNIDEVVVCYPGVRAIAGYRVANLLHRLGVSMVPFGISAAVHRETGIFIHPAARIGHAFSISHGTGTIIGETCVIGNNVRIQHGVTLGATHFTNNAVAKGIARHPVIGDNVVIYANTYIVGRVNIGADSVIGGGLWIDYDVPAGSVLKQAPAVCTIRAAEQEQIANNS